MTGDDTVGGSIPGRSAACLRSTSSILIPPSVLGIAEPRKEEYAQPTPSRKHLQIHQWEAKDRRVREAKVPLAGYRQRYI